MVKRKIACIILFTSLGLTACSFDGPHKPVASGSAPTSKGAGEGSAPTYEQVQPLFAVHCSACHVWHNNQAEAMRVARSGFLQSRVSRKEMPPPQSKQAASITQEARDQMVAWANSVKDSGQGPAPAPQPTPVDTISDRNLAFAFRCMRCHGPQGTSSQPDIPNLAAHDRGYIVNRLFEFMAPDARGTMMPGQMQVLANEFSLKDASDPATMELLNSVAAFYGTYDLSVTAEDLEKKRKDLSPDQMAVYETGKKLVAENACTSCHLQSNLRPMANTPMIFAQKKNYLLSRLSDFKKGLSGTVMPGVLEPIAESDLSAIALYLNLTHPSEYK